VSGMKIGVSAFAWTSVFTERHLSLLPALRDAGLQALEVPMFDPSQLPVSAMRRALKQENMDCTVCAILPAGINPISTDASIRKQSQDHLTRCILVAAELDAHLLGGPLFAPIGYLPEHRPTRDEWAWAIEAFQGLGDLLDSNEITLSLEPVNRSETFFLRTGAEARALCEAINHPRIGVTIDTFHANIEEKEVAQSVRMLGTHLKHLHLSENDRGLLGSGHVDFPSILKAATETGYNGYLMIEGFGYSADETQSPGLLWADKSVAPETLAFQGAAYLRGLLAQLESPLT
jgi:D-psicose/D-tagatose/L-ribulose 3-epimerase